MEAVSALLALQTREYVYICSTSRKLYYMYRSDRLTLSKYSTILCYTILYYATRGNLALRIAISSVTSIRLYNMILLVNVVQF